MIERRTSCILTQTRTVLSRSRIESPRVGDPRYHWRDPDPSEVIAILSGVVEALENFERRED